MLIREVSPNTLEGSFSDDLVLGKIWLIRKLSKISKDFGTIYILGSWYGNLSLLMINENLRFDRIVNIDIDNRALHGGARMARRLGLADRITSMCKDANELDYRHLGKNGLVINTSCNNIEGLDWFKNIPPGTMTALQSRDCDPGAVNNHNSLADFESSYPLPEMLFKGTLPMMDDDSRYDRFMLIGRV